jgi:hypothetical protein
MSEGKRAINPSGTVCRLCGDDSWHAVGSIACEARELVNLRTRVASLEAENARLKLATPEGQSALREEMLAYDFVKGGPDERE